MTKEDWEKDSIHRLDGISESKEAFYRNNVIKLMDKFVDFYKINSKKYI